MKKIFFILTLGLMALASCNEPYDPIGPNKPSPVLLINPLELAFDGAGGTLTSTVSTNADEITIVDAPDWIESVVVNEGNTGVSVIATPNTSSLKPREGVIRLMCASGDNTATQYLKVFQAGKGCKIAFEAFSGKMLPAGWSADDPSRVAVGNGYLAMTSDDIPGYIYTCPQTFDPSAQRYYFSVDVKMIGEGGVKLYVNDDPLQVVEIYVGYNVSTNRGGIWVRNGVTWCAMDDGVIGSDYCDNKYNKMAPVPPAGEREDWWRIEVFTTETGLNQPVVQVTYLKTFNGELQTAGVGYSRKFSMAKATTSKIALWARNYECHFRNFNLSYQQ